MAMGNSNMQFKFFKNKTAGRKGQDRKYIQNLPLRQAFATRTGLLCNILIFSRMTLRSVSGIFSSLSPNRKLLNISWKFSWHIFEESML